MRVQCRHCQSPIEIGRETAEEILCSTCGSTFRLDESATPTFVEPHRRLGKFQILGRVGIGGFGEVWRARDTELDRTVALKIMHTNLITSAGHRERFYREARAAAQLRHPGIVTVHDVMELEGSPAIVSEFIDGVTLGELLQTRRPSFRESAEILAQVAEALEYAHSLGIVHRDVKPGNIMLEFRRPRSHGGEIVAGLTEIRPRPRVLDFGLALRAGVEQTLTMDGQVLGTPAYMSPTLAAGRSHQADCRSDIYSLGVVLYELVCGELPFRGSRLMMLHQVLHEEPRWPRQINPKIPRDLETICLKAMAKSAAQRYHTARELADDLRRYLNGEPIAARPVGPAERLWRWCARNPMLAGLTASVAALLVILAIGATFAAFRLGAERNVALSNLDRAEKAETEVTEKLWDSYLAQARAGRWSGRARRRFDSLAALAKAAEIQPSLELRNEAIACMALADVRIAKQWEGWPPGTQLLSFDAKLERFARGDEKGKITVRRVADLREIAQLPGPDAPVVWILSFSPDGRYLAAKYQGSRFQLWDLERREATLQLPSGVHLGSADFSADSRMLALGQQDGSIAIFDPANGQELRRLPPAGLPYAMAFHPQEAQLAVSLHQSTLVHIRDLDSGKLLRTLPHPARVRGVAWRADGKMLATACADFQAYLWDLESPSSQSPQAVFKGHQAEVVQVAFNHAGSLLATHSWDGTARLWDPTTGKQLVNFPAGRGLTGFSPDDTRLGYALDGSKVGLWEVAAGSECRTLHHEHGTDKGPWCVDFSPDGRRLAISGKDVWIWDLAETKPVARLATGNTPTAVFLPDGKSLFTISNSGVQQWPINMERNGAREIFGLGPPQSLDTHSGVRRANLSDDGRVLVVQSVPGRVVVLDTASQQEIASLPDQPELVALAVSPDGKWVVTSAREESVVRVWSGTTGEPAHDLPLQANNANVAFSPDGHWLVTSTGEEYRFWKVGSWKTAHRIVRDRAGDKAGPMAFTRDGRMMAIALSRYVVRLVDPATGKQFATLEASEPYHLSWLSFSRDGGQLAAASESHVIQLWDLRAIREQLAQMRLDWHPPAVAGASIDD